MSRARSSFHRPRRGSTFRPQVEALEDRLPPGSLQGGPDPTPDLAFLAGIATSVHGAIQTTNPVLNRADFSLAPGSSTLTRTENGVTIRLTTSGLQPGAYTFWMRVDAPGAAPVAGRVAGHVVGESGIVNVAAHVNVGEIVGDPPLPLIGVGTLQDPLHATIRLVVRYHGPVDPGHVFEQTHTFQPELGAGPPADVRITIHPPPA